MTPNERQTLLTRMSVVGELLANVLEQKIAITKDEAMYRSELLAIRKELNDEN